jgi:hypothetical protein
MSLVRLADTPMIVGKHPETRAKYPAAKSGPVLSLPAGFEPCWTQHDVLPSNDPATKQGSRR